MVFDKDKLARVSDEDRQDIDFFAGKAVDPLKDVTGTVARSLAGCLRAIGIADYVVWNAPKLFKERVSEAAMWRARLFERFHAGDKISPSFVSMITYRALLDALAAGDAGVIRILAGYIGGRSDIEKEHDRPFDIAFGYSLKYIVLSDFEAAIPWVNKLEFECGNEVGAAFSGYTKLFKVILSASKVDAESALLDIVEGHAVECLGGGLFNDTEDELLCVWGVAVVNLARSHGLLIGPAEPLIPSDLLI